MARKLLVLLLVVLSISTSFASDTANATTRSTADCDAIKIEVDKRTFIWLEQLTWPEDGETLMHLRSSKNEKFLQGKRYGGSIMYCHQTCNGAHNPGHFKGIVKGIDEEYENRFACCPSEINKGVDEAFRRVFKKWFNER